MDSIIEISIGIPFYNAERFFALAVKSVLCQSFSAFELILSNDGSTDNSLEIAKSFNDPRIIILSDGINRGISYRLNEQIAISKGKYFVRMDADDIMFPERLNKQLEFLRTNPEIDVVGSYAVVIDDRNNLLGLRKSLIPDSIDKCFKSVPFIHPTVMGKTNWFKKYKYSNELKGVEDADLWIRSFNGSIFSLITEPLIFYRDPLNLKLSTYKFRTFQLLKLYKCNASLLNKSIYLSYKYQLIAIVKLLIYSFFYHLNIDSIILKRRNQNITLSEKNNYLKIIK